MDVTLSTSYILYNAGKPSNSSNARKQEMVLQYWVLLWRWKMRMLKTGSDPACNCMFKVNNRNTRIRCEICSKLRIKNNFEHVSHLVLVFLLLTLNM